MVLKRSVRPQCERCFFVLGEQMFFRASHAATNWRWSPGLLLGLPQQRVVYEPGRARLPRSDAFASGETRYPLFRSDPNSLPGRECPRLLLLALGFESASGFVLSYLLACRYRCAIRGGCFLAHWLSRLTLSREKSRARRWRGPVRPACLRRRPRRIRWSTSSSKRSISALTDEWPVHRSGGIGGRRSATGLARAGERPRSLGLPAQHLHHRGEPGSKRWRRTPVRGSIWSRPDRWFRGFHHPRRRGPRTQGLPETPRRLACPVRSVQHKTTSAPPTYPLTCLRASHG